MLIPKLALTAEHIPPLTLREFLLAPFVWLMLGVAGALAWVWAQ